MASKISSCNQFNKSHTSIKFNCHVLVLCSQEDVIKGSQVYSNVYTDIVLLAIAIAQHLNL